MHRKNPPPFGNNPLPDQEAAGTPHLCQGEAHHHHQGEVHHHQEEAQPPQLHTPSSKHLDGILQPWLHHQDPLSGTYAPKVVPVACASPILKPELFPYNSNFGQEHSPLTFALAEVPPVIRVVESIWFSVCLVSLWSQGPASGSK